MSSNDEDSIFNSQAVRNGTPTPPTDSQAQSWDLRQRPERKSTLVNVDEMMEDYQSFDPISQPDHSGSVPSESNLPAIIGSTAVSVLPHIEPANTVQSETRESIGHKSHQWQQLTTRDEHNKTISIKFEPNEANCAMALAEESTGTRDYPISLDGIDVEQVCQTPSFRRISSACPVTPTASTTTAPRSQSIYEIPEALQSLLQEYSHMPICNQIPTQLPTGPDNLRDTAIISEKASNLASNSEKHGEDGPIIGFDKAEDPLRIMFKTPADAVATREPSYKLDGELSPPRSPPTKVSLGKSQANSPRYTYIQPEDTLFTSVLDDHMIPKTVHLTGSSRSSHSASGTKSAKPALSKYTKRVKLSQAKIALHREKQKAEAGEKTRNPQPPQPAKPFSLYVPSLRDDSMHQRPEKSSSIYTGLPKQQASHQESTKVSPPGAVDNDFNDIMAMNQDENLELALEPTSDSDMDVDDESEHSIYDSDREFERKRSKYLHAKAKFQKRLKSSNTTVSSEEEIRFIQLTREYNERVKKRTQDRLRNKMEDSEENEPLFEHQDPEDDHSRNTESDDDKDALPRMESTAPMRNVKSIKLSDPSRKRTRSPGSDIEMWHALIGKRKGGKSKAKRSSKDSPKKKMDGKSKRTTSRKIKDPSAKVTKGKRSYQIPNIHKKGPSMMDMGSLVTGNVFLDAQGNENAPAMPILDSGRKADALKNLVASIPKEHRKAAQIDKNYLLSASKDFVGRGSCRVAEGQDGWKLKGMKCILKHHQLLGAAFMRRRERGDDEPRGGLCADQMGLGKTIMTLANIINGRKAKDEPGPRTTLIVATPALVTQWFNEIEKHCERKFVGQVLKHFGKNKLSTNDSAQVMRRFDIVLTTYNEVRRSYPKVDFPIYLQTAEEKNNWWKKYYDENRGLLHQVDFLRVVLDEAQCIKNHKSWTSIAARGLSAEHRWALSGTPIQNSVSELYPYFKFLQVPHTGTFKIFNNNYTGLNGRNQRGFDRLQSMLSRFMIRRTHGDELLGHKIITLPKASENLHWCKFSELERVIYETVRMRMIQRINRMSRSKELDRNYSNILTMLLRLRQLTCHTLILECTLRDLLTREDHEKLYELANEAAAPENTRLKKDDMIRLRKFLERQASGRGKNPKTTNFPGVDHDNVDERDFIETEGEAEPGHRGSGSDGATGNSISDNIGHQHGLTFDFLKYLATLRTDKRWEELQERTLCARCNDQPEQPWVTSCFHVYCYSCLEILQAEAASKDSNRSRCLECGIEYASTKACDNFDLTGREQAGSESDNDDTEGLRRRRRQKKRQLGGGTGGKDWIDMAGIDILPSAKTVAIKAQIINWIEQNPDVKIILYTQFLDMIRIMEKICRIERWNYSTYHGCKTHDARNKALDEFEKKPASEMRILLASLKCGGIGLNLTMAQRVIVVDPWWNSSIEQQAFCRVFRIGQVSETSMTRFVVENTVDHNMIRMQERKQCEIDEVMDGDKRKKLSVNELMQLFGEVDEGPDGQPFIMVEDRITHPNPMADEDDIYADER